MPERSSRPKQRGFVLPMAAIMFVCVIPVVGLVIDVGMLYIVQSKLSAAVDAGSLAGARSLSRGADGTAQTVNAQNTATAYVNANFPVGYMGSTNFIVETPLVELTQTYYRSVRVAASVQAPRLFMGWFSSDLTTVRASATATRRDVNVMVVMDRSGSLTNSGSCNAVKSNTIGFVSKFAEGRDYVGLITFATSSYPDFPIAQTFKAGITNVVNNVTCTGGTNSAQGLWQGYQALATLGQQGALNVILFFTDGQPTAITGDLPRRANCDNPSIRGVFAVGGQTPSGTGGVMNHVGSPQPMSSDMNLASGSQGCSFRYNWSNNWDDASGDVYVPTTDIWGNVLHPGYLWVNTSSGRVSVPNNSTGGQNLANAATNAADNAAWRIRNAASPGNGAAPLRDVVIFSIGLGNSTYPANHDFLRRVANDPGSTSFDTTKVPGLYVYAPTTADLTNAFNRVASEVLRLAK